MGRSDLHARHAFPRADGFFRRLISLFGVDLRSLAAFRIGLALLLLMDLCGRLPDLAAHYTDIGLLPRHALTGMYAVGGAAGREFWWSLHHFSGHPVLQFLLFLTAGFFAFCLLIGYRTRWAALFSWLLLISLQTRNPLILNGGDGLLSCLLFWSLFLPLGAVASVDAALRPPSQPPDKRLVSFATAAVLLQVCLMYWFTAAYKDHPRWNEEFSAVYYAMNIDVCTTRLGQWLLQFPGLMRFFTATTYYLEWIGPALVFIPWGSRWLRTLVVLAFLGFHASLALTMNIGLFPYVPIVAWMLFLPSEVWDAVSRWFARRSPQGLAIHYDWLVGRTSRWSPFRRPQLSFSPPGWRNHLLAAGMLVYVVLWNVRGMDFSYWEARILSNRWNVVARVTRMEQTWSMFAPYPSTRDGWFVFKGRLRDGSEVNLWDHGAELAYHKPDNVSRTFGNMRWRKYCVNLLRRRNRRHRAYLARWLGRRWNEQQAAGRPDRHVAAIEIIFQREDTPPPGEPAPPVEMTLLGRWKFSTDGHATTVSSGEDPMRTWTDRRGKRLVASFLHLTDGRVYLKAIDERIATIPLGELVGSDRQYVAARVEEDDWDGNL